jgi:diguanylate cyclase (GGDEF)-like protein
LKVSPVSKDIGLREWRAGTKGRFAARVTAVGFALTALFLTPFAREALPVSLPLLAALIGASIVTTAIGALLLLFQGRALNSTAVAILGAGFAFVAASMVPYLFAYPAMFGPSDGTHPRTSGVLWVGWHLALVAALVLYGRFHHVGADDARRRRGGVYAIRGFVVAYGVLLAIAFRPDLVPAYDDGSLSAIALRMLAPLLAAPGLAVGIAALRRRKPTVLDVGVGIIAVALPLDLYLTAIGMHPFSVGWYAGRVLMLLANLAVLGVLLAQGGRLSGELVTRARLLADEAYTDTLTGLPNRRRFDEELVRAAGSTTRRSAELAVAMIDIDRFKRYNDAFGHQAGDIALRRVGGAIATSVARSADFAARYGGEEFVVILEDTALDGAYAVAERIRNEVLRLGIPTERNHPLSVSIGVAARWPGEGVETLLRRADRALYEAKHAGRNRVTLADAERAVGT